MHLNPDHIFYQSSNTIKDYLTDLKQYNINHFDYVRSYRDGGRIYLASDPHLLENYFDNNLQTQGNVEAEPQLYQQQAVLWSTLQNQDVFQYEREHDIDNGIMLIVPQENYNEYFSFSGSLRKNPELVNFYLNNLDLLERFCASFKDNAHSLLTEAEKEKLILPFHQNAVKTYKVSNQEAFADTLHRLKLSKKHIRCAQLLLTGATTKEIAHQMSLSKRTIDDYMEELKYRLLARNKAELIIKLLHIFE